MASPARIRIESRAGTTEPAALRALAEVLRSVRAGGVDSILFTAVAGRGAAGAVPEPDESVLDAGYEALDALSRIDAPVTAVLHGSVDGPAFELCLAADLRVAAAGERFGFRHLRGAPVPLAGGATGLARLAGPAGARALLRRTDGWTAEELLAAGVIERVVPADALEQAAEEELQEQARRSPVATALLRGLTGPGGPSAAGALARERALFALAVAGNDRDEGVRAFFERRPPDFGRKGTR